MRAVRPLEITGEFCAVCWFIQRVYHVSAFSIQKGLKKTPSTALSQPWEFQCRAVAQTGFAAPGLTVG